MGLVLVGDMMVVQRKPEARLDQHCQALLPEQEHPRKKKDLFSKDYNHHKDYNSSSFHH